MNERKERDEMKKIFVPLLLLLNLLAIFIYLIWTERLLAVQVLQKVHMDTGNVLRELEVKCSEILKNKEKVKIEEMENL